MSERQFSEWLEAWQTNRIRAFEHTRAICWHIAAANRDPKKSFPTIEKFWPLPTDEKTHEVLTAERAAEIRRKYAEARELIERKQQQNGGTELQDRG